MKFVQYLNVRIEREYDSEDEEGGPLTDKEAIWDFAEEAVKNRECSILAITPQGARLFIGRGEETQ